MRRELSALKPKQVVAALGKAGFVIRRQTGSHVIVYKPGIRYPFPYLNILETYPRELLEP